MAQRPTRTCGTAKSGDEVIECVARMSNAPARRICNRQLGVLAGALFLLAATPGAAQSVAANTDSSTSISPTSALTHDADGHVIVRATRVTQPIRIDGRLDEAVYREVPAITEFIQQVPNGGAPITEKTEAWVYKAGRAQTWGIQLRRGLSRKNEFAYITPVSPAWAQPRCNTCQRPQRSSASRPRPRR